jgi:transposase
LGNDQQIIKPVLMFGIIRASVHMGQRARIGVCNRYLQNTPTVSQPYLPITGDCLMDQPRFVALDVHKSYVNAEQDIVLTPRRVTLTSLETWCQKHLHSTDEVVLEATTNAWQIHDLLEPLVSRVVVAHPYHVKLIASSFVKTDKRDTLALARLLAANLVPAIWVPPIYVRELRSLVAHYHRLVSQKTAARNRLQAVLHRNNITPPEGGLFNQSNREWWQSLEAQLSSVEYLRVQHDLITHHHLEVLIEQATTELAKQSIRDEWIDLTPVLLQMPGIALINAMTILSAIGDITRFPTAKKLVGYAGLGAKVYASGNTYRTGNITKQGRRELRTAMIEAAWVAVRYSPIWKDRFQTLEKRIGKMKAIVAIARKMLIVVWHVLTKHEADRNTTPANTERILMNWSTRHRLANKVGMKRTPFVHQQMQAFGVQPPAERPWHQRC